MLQQTRVAAALPFYERFLRRFPTVGALAEAAESDVLAHWAGLGYYSRARNLHRAARVVAAGGGVFPSTVEGIRALPGIGEYTAAAIGSMGFGLPLAAVDGNLLRVIARIDNDPADIGNSKTRARFSGRALQMLDPKHPGDFNQAMMELGATVCVPKFPRCGECPVVVFCAAKAHGREQELPVKARKQIKVAIEVLALVVRNRGHLLLWRRGEAEGQLAGFCELPNNVQLPEAVVGRLVGEVRHTITHHNYLYRVHLANWSGSARAPLFWVHWNRLEEVLLTTAAKKALACLTE